MYQTVIDDDIPLAEFPPTFQNLEDRVASALLSLHAIGELPEPDEVNEEQKQLSRAIFGGQQKASDADLSDPGVLTHLASLLNEYDKTVVKSAAQIRTYVTNKLLVETDNQNPNVRLRALEMLGKISDVGLFTEKTEITMRHRPTEELEQLLRERLSRVIDGEVIETAESQAPRAVLSADSVLSDFDLPEPAPNEA
jgi:hypothetical protein